MNNLGRINHICLMLSISILINCIPLQFIGTGYKRNQLIVSADVTTNSINSGILNEISELITYESESDNLDVVEDKNFNVVDEEFKVDEILLQNELQLLEKFEDDMTHEELAEEGKVNIDENNLELSSQDVVEYKLLPGETMQIYNYGYSNLNLKGDLHQVEHYLDRVILDNEGKPAGLFSSISYPISLPFRENYSMVVTNRHTETVTLYIPSEKTKVEYLNHPALIEFKFEANKSYRIKYTGTNKYFHLSNSKGQGNYFCDRIGYEYNSFYDKYSFRQPDMNSVNSGIIQLDHNEMYDIMFYEDWVYLTPYNYINEIEVTQLNHPVLYKMKLTPFESIEVKILQDDNYPGILSDLNYIEVYSNIHHYFDESGEDSVRTIDYILYDEKGDVTNIGYDHCADWYYSPTSVNRFNTHKMRISTKYNDVFLWLPYSQLDMVEFKEIQEPILYKFTLKSGEVYQIQNQHEFKSISLSNDASKTEGKTFSYELITSGGLIEQISNTDEKISLSPGETVTITVDNTSSSSITFYTSSEDGRYLVGSSSLGVLVEGITLENNIELMVGEVYDLDYKIYPSNASNQKIKSWESSNDSIVTVENGRIKAINKGTATITVTSVDGQKKAQTKVTVKEPVDSLEFNLPNKISDKIVGPTITFGGLSFPLFKLPLEVELNFLDIAELTYDSAKGTYTAIIGEYDHIEFSKNFYDSVRSAYKVATGTNMNLDTYNTIRILKNNLTPRPIKLGFEIPGSTYGYLEFKVEDGNFIYVDGGVMTSFEAEKDFLEGQVPIPSIPLTSLVFGLSGEANVDVGLNLYNKNIFPKIDSRFSFSPYLGLFAGIDQVLNAEAGIEGSLNTDLSLQMDYNEKSFVETEMKLSADLYLKYQALFFVNGKNTWEFASVPIYPRNEKMLMATISIEPDEFEIIPVNQQKSQFYSTAISRVNNAISNLKTNVYPYGEPQLVELSDNQQLLVWVDEDNTKSISNRTALYFSIFDGKSWSHPQRVDDEGKAELSPQLVISDDVYLVWQQASKLFKSNVRLDDVTPYMDIVMAKFNGKEFVDQTLISDSSLNLYDSAPKVSASNNEVSVVWTSNSENDYYGLSGETSIYRRKLVNNQLQDIELVNQNIGILCGIDTIYEGNNHIISYCVDKDSDLSTEERQLVSIQNSGTSIIQQGSNLSTPRLIRTGQGIELYWIDDQQAHYIDLKSPNQVVDIQLSSQFKNFNVLSNGADKVILVEQTDGFNSDVYASYYSQSEQKYGDFIPVTATGNYVRHTNGYLDDEGALHLAFNLVEVKENRQSGEEPYGNTHLALSTIYPKTDLSLVDGVYFDPQQVVLGNELPIYADLFNEGSTTIKDLKVNFYQGSQLISSTTIKETLNSGESKTISFNYFIPTQLNNKEIKVEVVPLSQKDVDLSNNADELKLAIGDLDIVSTQFITNQNSQLEVVIANKGYVTMKDIQLNLLDENSQGTVLQSKDLKSLASGEEVSVIIELGSEALEKALLKEGGKSYYLQVTSSDTELRYDNNECLVTQKNPYQGNYVDLKLLKDENKKITLSLSNQLPDRLNGILNLQVIKENGDLESVDIELDLEAFSHEEVDLDYSSVSLTTNDFMMIGVYDEHQKTISNILSYQYQENQAPIFVEKIELSHQDITLELGQTFMLVTNVIPANATIQDVSWHSSDESVATIENGMLVAKGKGVSLITVTSVDGNKRALCYVYVNEAEVITPSIPVLVAEDVTIELGSSFNLMDGVSAYDDIDGNITDLVKVSGTVDTKKVGTYRITYSITNSSHETVTHTRYVNVIAKEMSFPDVELGKWYTSHIQEFASLGYINGYADGTFKPQNSITRAEFVKIVNKAFELAEKYTPVTDLPFTDLDSQWKKDELKLALAAGYITPATEFRHNAPINRQEAAKIIGYLLEDTLTSDSNWEFADSHEIATWAKVYVAGLVEAGVLSQNESFRPKDPITRAEAVKMLNIARGL